MDSFLTKTSTLQELYKTYFSFANKFEFTSLLRNYIQNDEWRETSQENVWSMLSKVADDIGAVLTDDIVNYTRNVVDVNTCKTQQLIEHARMLSYNLDNIKNSYQFFPKRIQCLVDIFSINPEYLIGNDKNHILSDKVIKEILVYIRNNTSYKTPFTNDNVIDKLIDDPHSIINFDTYKNFIQQLFLNTMVESLSSNYSDEDGQPIAFNVFYDEIDNSNNIISRIDEYRTWVDKFISNEIEHPLDGESISNTIYSDVQTLMNRNNISQKFNAFKIANYVYFDGINPNNKMSQDELDLVEMVINYHSRNKYDYKKQMFVSDTSTKYAYYKELEWIDSIKMIVFVMNNIKSFMLDGLSYNPSENRFTSQSETNKCVRALQIFNINNKIVKGSDGNIVLNYDMLISVSKFLCDYVFYIQGIRENLKTISQKHAMRGSGALLVHIINDYLIKELPYVRDSIFEDSDDDDNKITFGWETNEQFNNYGNVKVIEYCDSNEYFNIDPENDVTFSDNTNERYWEQLDGMSDDDNLGVFTKGQIRDFYRNTLGIGRLQPKKSTDYDDIEDFLVDLFKIGANPISWNSSDKSFSNPIDDIINKSEEDYGYTKSERLEVQQNTQLRKNQENQFIEYSGIRDIVGKGMYDLVNNKVFYWKNKNYSSHVIHPFMYNLNLWNKLNNIIVNGYRDYVNDDLIDYMSSKVKFDELFGEFGECMNFWKYNVVDFSGYTTRYEATVKDEHRDDQNRTTSELTGYDGLFYPEAIKDFVEMYDGADGDFSLNSNILNDVEYWKNKYVEVNPSKRTDELNEFQEAIYSIYWQQDKIDGDYTFYNKWYSHLNYTRTVYQKIALQLWYWRDRIRELATTYYPISKYCLDIQGNSLILVQTFKDGEQNTNPYLIDLAITQSKVESEINGNDNSYASTCENRLVKPNELWIRWKSNPIAIPAFDIKYKSSTDDIWFDKNYRTQKNVEFGQLTHTNSDCNDNFKLVISDWNEKYSQIVEGNRLPVFFDMEQSANVIALSSWRCTGWDTGVKDDATGKNIYFQNSAKNPYHIISVERIGQDITEYNFTEYGSNDTINDTVENEYLFDSYHYGQSSGCILLPFYKFICSDSSEETTQKLRIKLFVINSQQLKNQVYEANNRVVQMNDIEIDLNKKVDFSSSSDGRTKYRFDHPIRVCRNTNLVFSPLDCDGMDKIKCAFLGNLVIDDNKSFKVNSCQAKTRYDFDSNSSTDLSLLKEEYYAQNNGYKYIDTKMDEDQSFNSYDSLDKYVFVIEFEPSIDSKRMFDISSSTMMKTYSYNILGDSGCIPHFAYQSLIGFGGSDCGTSYTWKNKYLCDKNHLQFELLGLEDKSVARAYDAMSKMVVQDLTDDCFTILNPQKLMEDIFRIWCETDDVDNTYFSNEYKQYSNPEISFDGSNSVEWEACSEKSTVSGRVVRSDMFELDLPESLSDETLTEEQKIDEYKELLDEYYVSILRADDGEIANEKRYILQPTQISKFILGVGGDDGFIKCNLNEWQSSTIQDNHFVPEQVVFTGTQNPFNYTPNGERIFSKPEELQYGNGICGVGQIELKVDIVTVEDEYGENHGLLKPTVRFTKFSTSNVGNAVTLNEKVQLNTNVIKEGEILVIFSHKNLDNIAKYHILNRYSNLYLKGSLPKNGENQFKFSDFKFSKTLTLVETHKDYEWTSVEVDEDGNPVLKFTIDQVVGSTVNGYENVPPYYIVDENGTPKYFLEQQQLVPKDNENVEFENGRKEITPDTICKKDVQIVCGNGKQGEIVCENTDGDEVELVCSDGNDEVVKPYIVRSDDDGTDSGIVCSSETDEDPEIVCNNNVDMVCEQGEKEYTYMVKAYKDIPTMGQFKWAHLVKSKPEKYLDYLYVKNRGLSFKVSEESYSISDTMETVPPFYIDEKLKNKLTDLNDVQILDTHSTFVHQSESPDDVKDCKNFNPINIDAILNYGIEQENSIETQDGRIITISGGSCDGHAIELDNLNNATKLQLQLEDGEIDEYLKIYTNYVKVDDGNGDFHFDLYFNFQNLFNSPFEYISTITNQPNVLILKDSYLYLSGDKYTNGKIDEKKVDKIKQGGVLTIYGQIKTYSDDKLSDTRTIKLFSYNVYNVSDDKPKFLIDKTFDIKQNLLTENSQNKVRIEFSDVLWTLKESQVDEFKKLTEDVFVTQPLHISYNYNSEDDSRIDSISFDIANDIIDFGVVPELCDWNKHRRTLRKRDNTPYYDRWSDHHMKLEKVEERNVYRITLNYDSSSNGYNFETIYLRWKLPQGFNVMDTTDRLYGYSLSSTAKNIKIESNGRSTVNNQCEVIKGHIVNRVEELKTMYLGLEHSSTKRMNGYVLIGLADELKNAIKESKIKQDVKGEQ